MGNQNSTRWKGHAKKRTVEEARRITPREAAHVAAPTVAAPVAGTTARRLYCLCEKCQKRSVYLYQLDPASGWTCRRCCAGGLIYTRQQQKGTRAAFAQWFTPEQREQMAKAHPARKELYAWYGREWFAQVAPYNFEHADEAARVELVERFGSAAAARHEFERRRWEFSDRLHEKEVATGQRINADILAWWKAHNRTQGDRKRSARNQKSAPTAADPARG